MINDTQDPYDQPYPTQPSAPSGDPWTPDELAQSQQWANQYVTSHQIPSSYGGPDDIANSYVQFRRGGMSHADAMAKLQTVPTQLGWDKYAAPAKAADTDPGAPPPTGGAPPPAPSSGPAPSHGTLSAPSVGPGTTAPGYTPPPAYVPPPAFTYDAFSAPTGEDVLNDPGYKFSFDQGAQALNQSAAARGVLNTGGTLKDILGFGQNLAATRYDDVYSRKLNTYNTNRGNAFDTYKTNYGIGKDAYDTNVINEYNNPFTYGMQSAGLNQNNNQFNASLGQANNQFNSNMDFNRWLEDYKRSVLDPFDQRYKTLSLL